MKLSKILEHVISFLFIGAAICIIVYSVDQTRLIRNDTYQIRAIHDNLNWLSDLTDRIEELESEVCIHKEGDDDG